jgi:RES domain-containing protein
VAPEDWQENPAPVSTMDLGTGWLQANSALALILPSCIIPYENNAILNPLHPAFHSALNSVQQLPLFLIPAWLKKPHLNADAVMRIRTREPSPSR